MTVATILFHLPYQLVFLSTLTTITDAVEYGQLKNGVCNEAVTLSIRLLLDKIAGGFVKWSCWVHSNGCRNEWRCYCFRSYV
ncbi:MFS transporter [Leuconostoc falkenbergense]|uniref:MFS transporter n=1 Tax=Leuconostoc falkenbergense TaxID=2766470 RepID=UPI003D153F63